MSKNTLTAALTLMDAEDAFTTELAASVAEFMPNSKVTLGVTPLSLWAVTVVTPEHPDEAIYVRRPNFDTIVVRWGDWTLSFPCEPLIPVGVQVRRFIAERIG